LDNAARVTASDGVGMAGPETSGDAPQRAGLVLTAVILVAGVANLNLSVANVALADSRGPGQGDACARAGGVAAAALIAFYLRPPAPRAQPAVWPARRRAADLLVAACAGIIVFGWLSRGIRQPAVPAERARLLDV
jgi:hypothetical protein